METKIKIDPIFPLSTFGKVLDDLFNKNLNGVGTEFAQRMPAVNILETEDAYELEFAVPGLSKSDFNISVEKDQLTVSANKEVDEGDSARYRRREFSYGSFRRSFTLPDTLDKENIKAQYENGVLRVIIAKVPEVELKRTIKVG